MNHRGLTWDRGTRIDIYFQKNKLERCYTFDITAVSLCHGSLNIQELKTLGKFTSSTSLVKFVSSSSLLSPLHPPRILRGQTARCFEICISLVNIWDQLRDATQLGDTGIGNKTCSRGGYLVYQRKKKNNLLLPLISIRKVYSYRFLFALLQKFRSQTVDSLLNEIKSNFFVRKINEK